jgi:hypothetical protein
MYRDVDIEIFVEIKSEIFGRTEAATAKRNADLRKVRVNLAPPRL